MAHLIETMAYSGEKPWHGLGVEVEADLTPDEMVVKAGLDWTVSKRALELDGKPVTIGGAPRYALQRDTDGEVFCLCADKYKPVQNVDAFQFFDKFVKAGNMAMETAGSLDGGKRVWGLARMNDADFIVANKNDKIESFVLLVLPHHYGESVQILYTPTRVVCNNTLTMALSEKSADGLFRMRHTRQWDADVMKEAELALGLSAEHKQHFKESAEFLASVKATDKRVQNYFGKLFQPKLPANAKAEDLNRVMNKVLEAYEVQPGAEYSNGTWWTAFNAVTYYLDHHAGRDQNTRVRNAMIGSAAVTKRKALVLATDMAKAA